MHPMYLEDFDDYVQDFEKFYSFIVAENKHSINAVLGDSMGLIASLAM
jgi:alpha-beta hydrolase superfamily lysophospholipase